MSRFVSNLSDNTHIKMQEDMTSYRKQEEDSLHVGSGWLSPDMVGKIDMAQWGQFFSTGTDSNDTEQVTGISERIASSSLQTKGGKCWKECSHESHINDNFLVLSDPATVDRTRPCPSFQLHQFTPAPSYKRHGRDPGSPEPDFEPSKRSRLRGSAPSNGRDPRPYAAQRTGSDCGWQQADFDTLSVGPGVPWMETSDQ